MIITQAKTSTPTLLKHLHNIKSRRELWIKDFFITSTVRLLRHLIVNMIQEVPGSIPGYTLEFFLEVWGLERGPPSLVRPIG